MSCRIHERARKSQRDTLSLGLLSLSIVVACGPGTQSDTRSSVSEQTPSSTGAAETRELVGVKHTEVAAEPGLTEPSKGPVAAVAPAAPPAGAKIRTIRPALDDSRDCVEMYNWCRQGATSQCTTAPFMLACEQVGQLPGSAEWLRCECP